MTGRVLEVGDVIELKMFCYQDAQMSVNRTKFVVDGVTVGEPTTIEDVAQDWYTALALIVPAQLATTAFFMGTKVACINQGPPPPAPAIVQDPVAGTNTTDPLPGQVSLVVKSSTALAGRENRGRIYLPFPCEDGNGDDHRPNATYITWAGAVAAEFFTRLAYGLGTAVVTGRTVIATPIGGSLRPVTGYAVRTVWGTMRKRGSYGRSNPPIIS